jgi:hypothetical protein
MCLPFDHSHGGIMPRHEHYIEWAPDRGDREQTTAADARDIDIENPFDDPEVRRRMAELIARAARQTKKSSR